MSLKNKKTRQKSGFFLNKKIYFKGFSPLMIRIKKNITAITSSICIKLPSIWKPRKPTSHKTNKTIAIVVSI